LGRAGNRFGGLAGTWSWTIIRFWVIIPAVPPMGRKRRRLEEGYGKYGIVAKGGPGMV